jgi:ABC-2 type transport system ATP-binding protein
VPVREAGLAAAVRGVFSRKTRDVHAVVGVSFEIAAGEIVGFLGPNGAGKTTTLKMLAGLLRPTGGVARVLGHIPFEREHAYLRRITLLMGNRNQLQWDLPGADSFELNRAIYRIPWQEYRKTRDELVELLALGALVDKPVRTLSLGERMRMETAAALLHRPSVLFLDEPTIGLDVTMQKQLRGFLREHNAAHGATVLLTSHNTADIESLCARVMLVDEGRMLFDGPLSGLGERFLGYREIEVALEDADADLSGHGEVVRRDGSRVRLRVPRSRTAETTARLLTEHRVIDLTVEDPPVADLIELAFSRTGTA